MRFWHVLTLSTAVLAAPRIHPRAARPDISLRSTDASRAAAVKDAFRHSWSGYTQWAWGCDELYPVSGGCGNSRNGWGASIADALSTAALMELDDVVLQALQHLDEVDFRTTTTQVSLFETTIRYLGGLLSGYDLLKGPYAHIAPNGSDAYLVDRLLEQAVVLADRLAFAFNTPSGVPYNELDFATNSSTQETNGLATTGTLVLEWTRLSDLTGNLTYASLAQKAESYLLRPLPVNIAEPFPGMLGNDINITSGDFTSSAGGWSGGTDSFYEYLLKMWVYSPSRFSTYKDRWIDAVNSTLHYLMQPVYVNPAGSFVMEYNDATSMRQSQGHLTCFIGGNLILGGDVLGRADIKAAGLSLTKGCRDTYASTQSGIGPERWGWDNQSVPTQFTAFYETAGYYPTVMSYDLRPEVVESYYHAFKLTGDERYKDWAWEAFVAIHKACWTKYGYSAIEDVTIANGGGKSDFQESFWFAEVLKYLFLTFQESEVSVKSGRNGWVFNTEAHPLKTMD